MLKDLGADLRRAPDFTTTYQAATPSRLRILRYSVERQEVWAIVEYRMRRWGMTFPSPLRQISKIVGWLSRHVIECLTGISLPTSADIGPGFAIAHIGPVIVHGEFRAGDNLTLSHQTTVGAQHGRVPTAGDCVFIGPGARVIGGISLGDRAMIGANAVVTRDVAADHVAVGVPAVSRPDRHEPWLTGAHRPQQESPSQK